MSSSSRERIFARRVSDVWLTCFQRLHCVIFCRYCVDRDLDCFARGRGQCFDFVLSKMFETRKYALSEALLMNPLNHDRFRAWWLIRYRQDVADTDAMAQ